MPARIREKIRARSDLPMTDLDIWLDYKNAKNPRIQIRILAELNETSKEIIEEILAEQKAVEEKKRILKEEQEMSQTKERTPEQKARKAAYMKEYWARKKAEKVSVVKTEETEQEVVSMEDPKTQQEDSELIRKALKNFSIGLEEAIEDQKAILEATKKKLAAMEADLKRCRELLGYEIEAKEDAV